MSNNSRFTSVSCETFKGIIKYSQASKILQSSFFFVQTKILISRKEFLIISIGLGFQYIFRLLLT